MKNLRMSALRAIHVVALLALASGTASAGDKTDVIVLINGDHITGEIKELSYGHLQFKTDDMGTLAIEWDKIASLSTTQVLQVELLDGRRLIGRVPENGSRSSVVRLLSDDSRAASVTEVPMSDIVRMATLDQNTWYKRLDGAVSMGYTYTQANDLQVLNLSANIGTRTSVRRWNIALESQVTTQNNAGSSERASLVAALEHYRRDNYYAEETLEFTRNQELGLDLRSLVGASFGRYLMQKQGREWRAGAGLAASSEQGNDGLDRQSIEARFSTDLRIFRFDYPKTNITTGLTLLPSLSDWGRVRGEATINVRRELVSDLFLELSLKDSYDNRSPEGRKSNDWGAVTSIGYSF